tara:strand:+ start:90 stop:347 length:258 start_codon:yes stop_codon:yes gene_type:complete
MNALEFYKSHESAPLPNVGDLVSLTVEELCELMEQYHQSKVNNSVLDDVSKQRELLKAFVDFYNYRNTGDKTINNDEIEIFIDSL